MLLRYAPQLSLLMAAGLALVLWHRSMRGPTEAELGAARVAELEKKASALMSVLQKLEHREAELKVRGDDLQRRLSDEGAQLVDTQGRLEKTRTSLNVCVTEKNKIQDQIKQETETILKLNAASKTLEDTTAQLMGRVEALLDLCKYVADGSLAEARKLCPVDRLVQKEPDRLVQKEPDTLVQKEPDTLVQKEPDTLVKKEPDTLVQKEPNQQGDTKAQQDNIKP